MEKELTDEEDARIDEMVETAFRHIEVEPLTESKARALFLGVPFKKDNCIGR